MPRVLGDRSSAFAVAQRHEIERQVLDGCSRAAKALKKDLDAHHANWTAKSSKSFIKRAKIVVNCVTMRHAAPTSFDPVCVRMIEQV